MPPIPGTADDCSDEKSAKRCGRAKGCMWCEGMMVAGQCFSEVRLRGAISLAGRVVFGRVFGGGGLGLEVLARDEVERFLSNKTDAG